METKIVYCLIIILQIILFIAIVFLNPKLDWNYETGHRILWITNPFNNQRIFLILYRDESKIK
jgi:hypothetical protein